MSNVALNGYGRIGRVILRNLFERGLNKELNVVAINDLGDPKILMHLTRFDSAFGRFPGEMHLDGDTLYINDHPIRLLSEKDPSKLPWKDLGVELVMENTGRFKKRELAEQHLTAGAKKVLLSHPAGFADKTIVYGVNDDLLSDDLHIVSNASCTTNCLAPLAKVLHEAVGIRKGLMTTIHSYTNDQNLLDRDHKDLYRSRAAAMNIIPTTTGAASAIGLVIPALQGRMDGLAVRVPSPNVSLVDLTFNAEKPVDVEIINNAIKEGAKRLPKYVLEASDLPLVSRDFSGYPVSSIVDLNQTHVQDDLVKVLSWYDNEWGYSNRMLDIAKVWLKV